MCFRLRNLGVRWPLAALGLIFPLLLTPPVEAATGDVWIEGEAAASVEPGSLKPAIENVGRPSDLSGGLWLHLNVEPGDVDRTVPADGIVLTYPFGSPAATTYPFCAESPVL